MTCISFYQPYGASNVLAPNVVLNAMNVVMQPLSQHCLDLPYPLVLEALECCVGRTGSIFGC